MIGLGGMPFLRFNRYRGETVLVAQAHPDDGDWNCGGTAARLAKAGARVIYVMATDGAAGSKDPEMTKERLAETRRAEQREANAVLGVDETIFLGHPDGGLRLVQNLDKQIAGIIRRYRPALFITFDPEWPEDEMHPDHRAVSMAALRAARFSSLRLAFTDENTEPWECKEILLFNPRRPDVWVNVAGFANHKLKALAAHESQMAHMLPPWTKKLMGRLIARGNTLDALLVMGILHTHFLVEPFRRFPSMGLLR